MSTLIEQPVFQKALFNIIDNTQDMIQRLGDDEVDLHEIGLLAEQRNELMLDFEKKYAKLIRSTDQAQQIIFSKIYQQLLKKQRKLDDTISNKLSYVKNQIADMKRERIQRTQYVKSPAVKARAASVFITSKLHG